MPRKGINPDLNEFLQEIRSRVKAMDDGGEMFARDPKEWALRARHIAKIALDGPDDGLMEASMHMAAASFMACRSAVLDAPAPNGH